MEVVHKDDLNRIVIPEKGFINTQEFRREALHFVKHGYYCPEAWGSPAWKSYWKEQLRRCDDGYSVGGVKITGDHYAYLNFAQIKLTSDPRDKSAEKVTKRRSARKIRTFPDFWDGDYSYFHAKELAVKHGKHLIVSKSRRKGYSYKNGLIAANRYNIQKESITVIGAFLKDYLYPDGTMSMARNYVDFFNESTGWAKRRLIDKMDHLKSGYKLEGESGIWSERGYKSQIYAVTFNNNPGAARGKDGTLVLLEEAGKFPNLKESFMSTKPTVEDGIYTTGLIILFGTGGGDDSNWADFEDMFYDPGSYNILSFDNIWDEDSTGTTCGFFVPDFLNKPGFMDSQGNSLIKDAHTYEDSVRQGIIRNAKDTKAIDRHVAEYPYTPKEAFLRIAGNIFPTKTLQDHYNTVLNKGAFKHLGVAGKLAVIGNKIKHVPDDTVRPIMNFPLKGNDDPTGGVMVFQSPYRDKHGNIPPNMYTVCHDPYAYDTPYSNGSSLGAAYVMKNVNNISNPSDMIVASYVGRPEFQDEYNKTLFMLADYYNAQIGFENDRGDVVGYAKRFKLLDRLAPEFEMGYDDKLKKPHITRTYGMAMGSGKENLKRKQGLVYLRDWLITPRGKTSDGNILLNLHLIFDPALLLELIKYDEEKVTRFDRVAALIVGVYHMKEFAYNSINMIRTDISTPAQQLMARQLY